MPRRIAIVYRADRNRHRRQRYDFTLWAGRSWTGPASWSRSARALCAHNRVVGIIIQWPLRAIVAVVVRLAPDERFPGSVRLACTTPLHTHTYTHHKHTQTSAVRRPLVNRYTHTHTLPNDNTLHHYSIQTTTTIRTTTTRYYHVLLLH